MTECPLPDHVFYEFIQFGNSLRVSAACPKTLVEVTVIGPPTAVEMLKRTARRKLGMAIVRHQAAKAGRPAW
ncbi:MAG: hypothetical protein ACFCVH_22790 [Alphaproteobacteria bacterium]